MTEEEEATRLLNEIKSEFNRHVNTLDKTWYGGYMAAESEELVLKRLPPEMHVEWEKSKKALNFDDFDTNKNLIISPTLQGDIAMRVDAYIRKNPSCKQVLFHAPYPLTLEQVIIISNTLTESYKRPIVVWPEAKQTHYKDEVKVNYYCKAKIRVVLEHEQHLSRLELFKTYKESNREGYHIAFMSERNYRAGVIDPSLPFNFDRHVYYADLKDRRILVLSGKPLEVGEEYEVKGLVFDIPRIFDSRFQLGAKQTCIVTDEVVEVGLQSISPATIKKCKGRDMEWFMRSVMYPYHNCVEDYAMLITLQTFHLATGFPFNVIVIGMPNSGKTSVLHKFESVTGEVMLSGGAGTAKGLMPSFGSQTKDCGYLARAKYKAMVNEFFSYLSGNNNVDRKEFMSRAKDILEGKKFTYESGNGKQRVQMTADLLAVGNPPDKQGAGKFTSVMEMYEYFDNAMMDRILYYWQPFEQNKIVKTYKHVIKAMEGPIIRNGSPDLTLLDYGDLLDCEDLRSVLCWGRKAKYTFEDAKAMDEESMTLAANIPTGIFSRNLEFMINAATAFAVIRSLGEGTVTTDTKSIVVTKEDVHRARLFIQNMVNNYTNDDGDSINLRFKAVKGLTPMQSKVFGILCTQWEQGGDDKHVRMVRLDQLKTALQDAKEMLELLESLRHKHLAVYNATHCMLFPDVSPEVIEAYDGVVHGFQPDDVALGFKAVKLGLLTYDDNLKAFNSPWKVLSEYAEDAEPMLEQKIAALCDYLASEKGGRTYEGCYMKGISDSIINKAKRIGKVVEQKKGWLTLPETPKE